MHRNRPDSSSYRLSRGALSRRRCPAPHQSAHQTFQSCPAHAGAQSHAGAWACTANCRDQRTGGCQPACGPAAPCRHEEAHCTDVLVGSGRPDLPPRPRLQSSSVRMAPPKQPGVLQCPASTPPRMAPPTPCSVRPRRQVIPPKPRRGKAARHVLRSGAARRSRRPSGSSASTTRQGHCSSTPAAPTRRAGEGRRRSDVARQAAAQAVLQAARQPCAGRRCPTLRVLHAVHRICMSPSECCADGICKSPSEWCVDHTSSRAGQQTGAATAAPPALAARGAARRRTPRCLHRRARRP